MTKATAAAVAVQAAAVLHFVVPRSAGQALPKDAPTVTPFSFPTDLSEGASAQVLCAISKGALPVYFTWLKNGKTVGGDEANVKVTTSDRFSVLQVLSVSAADVGNYTCFAKNLQGSDTYSVMLEVRAPPRWLRMPADVSALIGSEARLSCPVAGHPVPRVTWSKVTDGNRVRLEAGQSDGVLVLRSVQPRDRGVYVCEADNGVGEPIANKVRLSLNGKVTDRPPPPSWDGHGRAAARYCAPISDNKRASHPPASFVCFWRIVPPSAVRVHGRLNFVS